MITKVFALSVARTIASAALPRPAMDSPLRIVSQPNPTTIAMSAPARDTRWTALANLQGPDNPGICSVTRATLKSVLPGRGKAASAPAIVAAWLSMRGFACAKENK